MFAFISTDIEALINNAPHSVLNQRHVTNLLMVTVVILSCVYYYRKLTFWSSLGIKTPLPLPIFGNILEMHFRKKRIYDLEWRDKYGKVYGYYRGMQPRLVIADAEILRRICIKDFQYFTNHYIDADRNKFQKSSLVSLKDSHWKRVRSLMTPTFTSGKMKHMFNSMRNCSTEMVSQVAEKKGKILDVKNLVGLYAMDVITTCCYGLKLNPTGSDGVRQASSRHSFVEAAFNIMKPRLFRLIVSAVLPDVLLEVLGFKAVPDHYTEDLYRKTLDIIETRRRSARQDHRDYLQLLLNAKFDDKLELNEMDKEENHHAGLTEQSILRDQAKMVGEVKAEHHAGETIKLSELEIVSNSMFLLIVGYHTTATLMSHFLYAIAHHQDVQEQLYQELRTIVGEDGESIDYDSVTSAIYLDAVISETLRRLGPVFFMDRVCNQDYYLEEYKMTIPKGTILDLSYYTIMNDPDYWNEPEKFDPSRFLPTNRSKIVPGSYCPFGLGPRHCIGMRFSLTESKVGLAKLILKYRFDPVPGTPFPPPPALITAFLNMNKNLYVIPRLR